MKSLLFLFLFTPLSQSAELPLQDLEAHCWSQTEDNGSFRCQDLMLLGKVNGEYAYPELAADADEKKTWHQANFACQALGFRYSTGFELDRTKKETLFIRLDEFNQPMTWRGEGDYVRHLLCQ